MNQKNSEHWGILTISFVYGLSDVFVLLPFMAQTASRLSTVSMEMVMHGFVLSDLALKAHSL